MHENQKPTIDCKEKETLGPQSLNRILFVICTLSLGCYLLFSHGLRYLLSGWDYFIVLYNMVFPKGILRGLPQSIPLVPSFPNWNTGLLFIGFLLTCVASAWFAHFLLGGKKSELGPHLILFSLATAIVPTLMVATFYWPDGRGNLSLKLAFYSSLFILFVLAGLKLIFLKHKILQDSGSLSINHESLNWAWAFILPLIPLFSFVYLRGVVSYSCGGYDSMFYHLPLAASWFHNGSITRGVNLQFHYPGNTELMFRWGFICGSEHFTFLVSFFATILCIYMVYKLGRIIGQGRQAAIVSACCTATVPLIPFLASTSYTDMMGVLFLLLSVFFLIRWAQTSLASNSQLVCSGLAAGLAAGSKLSMLPSVFTIFMIAMVVSLRSRKIWQITGPRPENVGINWSWPLTRAGIFCSIGLLGGGYWYLRNLIENGNPFYPIAMLGMPGLHLKDTVQMYPVFAASPLKRLLYPWTELNYGHIFDDGIGGMIGAIVIPALIIWPFLRKSTKGVKLIGPGLTYTIVCISFIMFVWSGNMIMRYGIFLFSVCFLFIGEIWKRVSTIHFKVVTLAAFLIMIMVITRSIAGGYLYTYVFNKETTRYERLHVPKIVDDLPPTKIFNAASSYHTLGLMGRDYNHEVITLMDRAAKPEDILQSKARYVLIEKAQEDTFMLSLKLKPVGTPTKDANPVALWEVID